MARAGEDELIARYFAPLAGPGGLGLNDDAALVAVPCGRELIVTVDAVVAGVHFLPDDPPASIAVKALGVNLSDLAAKGAEPVGFVMALALPEDWTEDWLAAFAGGLGGMAERCGCALLGGDTVRAAGPLSVSITAFGSVPVGRMVRRTTARAGDLIAVTGTIGDAALGLDLLTGAPAWAAGLSAEQCGFLEDRYRHPRPRLALAASLRQHASAAMDVSDGLVGDAAKMLRASGVTGTLDLDRIPLSRAAKAALAMEAADQAGSRLVERIAGGGDDYEILFTLSPARRDAMTRAAAALGLAVTIIGEVRDGQGPPDLRFNGSPHAMAATSFQHFGA